ncbi:carboxymuconolactone decarboxylase family protein [Pseudomonas gingeri]|nr:carboxymuconolactone decarboxylase family protein [Pseudomonas gingeri]NWE34197.1 carboxymuconolactone decarboxylase family protein [Pseudomonas gingeri]NWE56551.1 carboxymuconolactone decarboxylase family protein [Pseudomonas gingeri]NWF01073.1 carboxymuconolactone decarboxylase family protein [Pseudomonas gingeri]
MARIPDIELEQLSFAQAEIYQQIVAGPRGAVVGPLRVWLHNPQLASLAQALGAYCRYGTGLPTRLSELAIVVVAAHWKSGLEWSVHAPLALQAGISSAVLEAIRTFAAPEFDNEDERVVYEFSRKVLEDKTVAIDMFKAAMKALGQAQLIDLVGVLGYYCLISMTINVFEIWAPGAVDPFDC